ncbi:ABC transporter ATP-binding protein [Hydrogenophaga sp. PBL-H3]|nr:ABC transporter ATP-binding protein [Hydrogenophaga sp. PBL-H3]
MCSFPNGAACRPCVSWHRMNQSHNTSAIQPLDSAHEGTTRAGTTRQPLMRLTGASKQYDMGSTRRDALRSVDLDIHRGEFTAIVGPSGSGKSALMKILSLLEAPSSGGYRFQGVPEQSLSDEQRLWLRRRFFGFVPQEYNLLRSTSLQGNVALPLMYRGLSAERCQTAAMRALSLVGLEDCGHKMPDELTGTQHGKAGIARALICNPSVLLVDRASRSSDQPLCPDIGTLLRRLNTEHLITVVLVTQEAHAADWAQRVVHVNGGTVAQGRASALH